MLIRCELSGKEVECKSTQKGNPKLPRGWKWRGGKAYSSESWNALYSLRAITVNVVSPNINGDNVVMKSAWNVLDQQLKNAWEKSTALANLTVRRLWSNDVTRSPGQVKCPPMPPITTYQKGEYDGWSQSAGAVIRTIEQCYRRKRYEIIWTGSAGIPTVRYPYPYPLHNASWNIEQSDGGEVIFGCRLPDCIVSLKLRTKDKCGKYRLDALRHLSKNPDLRCEASIYKKRDGALVVKLVGWFPKTVRELAGELIVRTDPASFVIVMNDRDERLLVLNGDFIRRKMAAHWHGLQRWREDQKFEIRTPKRKNRKTAEDMQKHCRKMEDRVKSFIDESCAQIVGHAIRRKLAVVRYDDSCRSYFSDFAWHRMATRLEAVCDREGISFEYASAGETMGTSRTDVNTSEDT